MQAQHRSPGFGRSPARHSQHPLNKSLDLNKSTEIKSSTPTAAPSTSDLLLDKSKKVDAEPVIDRDSSRKFSVESKDSDVDSAKSSLPDATVNGLPDFSKEDSTDTLYSSDKHTDIKSSNEQAPTMNKKDEGYVSAEKDQNDNAQDNVSKQRDNISSLVDKISPQKGFNKRLSTEEAQEPAPIKQNSMWPDFLSQQQQLVEEQQRKQQHLQQQQHQKHDIANNFDGLGKQQHQQITNNFDGLGKQQQQKHDIPNNFDGFGKQHQITNSFDSMSKQQQQKHDVSNNFDGLGKQQQQKHDVSNSFDGLSKETRQDGSKNIVDAFTSKQQQYEALLGLNQMFSNHQRKSGEHQNPELAYMQQYMKVCFEVYSFI